MASSPLSNLELDDKAYVDLLSKLIGESKYVQNSPPKLNPQEDRVANHVKDVLGPYSTSTGGGPLIIQHIHYDGDEQVRGNLIVEYPGTVPGKVVSFVGMHMDVVPANADEWKFDPFSLSIDGDKLQGRGTTDCLGHVALITELLKDLAQKKISLKTSVVAVIIVNEEDSTVQGIGVEQLFHDGYLNKLKNGPLYWVDSSDKQPCIGTGGMIPWHLTTTGKLFHSGFPQKAINALELSMEALKVMQTRFYKDVPPVPEEEIYKFEIPSTMKPTQWSYPGGGINQIPGECTITGDVRLTPFYRAEDVKKTLKDYVIDINKNVEKLDTRGPVSKYVLPDEGLRGSLEITFDAAKDGVACDLNSRGYKVLSKATKEVVGSLKPFSVTGTLPLVNDLMDAGYDVQMIGYGLTDTYHADNEYCNLSDMHQGYSVFVSIIAQLEED